MIEYGDRKYYSVSNHLPKNALTKERITREGQITSVGSIVPGMIVAGINDRYGTRIMRVNGFAKDKKFILVEYLSSVGGGVISSEASLADRGVIPYDNGRWNEMNWLRAATKDEETRFLTDMDKAKKE